MNYGGLIKRALAIAWRYKVLWIVGFLLALSGGGGGNFFSSSFNRSNLPATMSSDRGFPDPGVIATFVVLCCCLMAILVVVLTIVQYVARTGLYRAVDQIEEDAAGPSWRTALRLGWSNRALRMFLLDLVVGLAMFVLVMALLLLAFSPLLLLIFDNDGLRFFGGILTAGSVLLASLVIAVVALFVAVLQQFWRRQIALDDRSVGQALALGTQMARRKAGDVAVFWLAMAVIGFLFGLVLMPVIFALVLLGGGIGLALYALFDSVWLVALIGIPFFVLIAVVPLLIVQGIYLVFESSAWTLAYRDLRPAFEQSLEVTPAAPQEIQ